MDLQAVEAYRLSNGETVCCSLKEAKAKQKELTCKENLVLIVDQFYYDCIDYEDFVNGLFKRRSEILKTLQDAI